MNDSEALQRAFDGTEGVFVLLLPNFDPSPGFPETRRIVGAVHSALDKARPDRVVCISTIGAQTRHENLLSQLGIMEQVLSGLPMPITFLRPGWYMENAAWDVAPARGASCSRWTSHCPWSLPPMWAALPPNCCSSAGQAAVS
jgi:uncharacterized protein YbjT (DUF2867 family)